VEFTKISPVEMCHGRPYYIEQGWTSIGTSCDKFSPQYFPKAIDNSAVYLTTTVFLKIFFAISLCAHCAYRGRLLAMERGMIAGFHRDVLYDMI